MAFDRITVDPEQMGGMPCIRGLRIPVSTVVGMVADGMDFQEILESYPDLEKEDIAEALRFAATAVRERELPLIKAEELLEKFHEIESKSRSPKPDFLTGLFSEDAELMDQIAESTMERREKDFLRFKPLDTP
jgi:uncharacterized protein (DUF433 family)